ncbi:MAG: FABP family protein, partial [Microbacterium sp.]
GAKNYAAATRMYGLVENHLLWAWDIAALGNELGAHASARLAKVD